MADLPVNFIPNTRLVRQALDELQQQAGGGIVTPVRPMNAGVTPPTFGNPTAGGIITPMPAALGASPGLGGGGGGAEASARRIEMAMDRVARSLESVVGRLERTGAAAGGGRQSGVVAGGEPTPPANVIPYFERSRDPTTGRFITEPRAAVNPWTTAAGASSPGMAWARAAESTTFAPSPFAPSPPNPWVSVMGASSPGMAWATAAGATTFAQPTSPSTPSLAQRRGGWAPEPRLFSIEKLGAFGVPRTNPATRAAGVNPALQAGGTFNDANWIRGEIARLREEGGGHPIIEAAIAGHQARLEQMGEPAGMSSGVNEIGDELFGDPNAGLTPTGMGPLGAGPRQPRGPRSLGRIADMFLAPNRRIPGGGNALARHIRIPGIEGPAPMGLYFMATFGMMEVGHAANAAAVARTAEAAADTDIERQEVWKQAIDAQTSGPLGSLVNAGRQFGNWLGERNVALYGGRGAAPLSQWLGRGAHMFETRGTVEASFIENTAAIRRQERQRVFMRGVTDVENRTRLIGLEGDAADTERFRQAQETEAESRIRALSPNLATTMPGPIQAAAVAGVVALAKAQRQEQIRFQAHQQDTRLFNANIIQGGAMAGLPAAQGNFGIAQTQQESFGYYAQYAQQSRQHPELEPAFRFAMQADMAAQGARIAANNYQISGTTNVLGLQLNRQGAEAQRAQLRLEETAALQQAQTSAQQQLISQQYAVRQDLITQSVLDTQGDIRGETKSSGYRLARNYDQARRQDIWNRRAIALRNAPDDDTRTLIRGQFANEFAELEQELGDRDTSIRVGQETSRRAVEARLARNIMGARAIETAGGARSEALQFQQRGMTEFRNEALNQGIRELGLQKQNYMLSFRAENVNLARVGINNARDTENPSAVLSSINDEIRGLRSDLNNLIAR